MGMQSFLHAEFNIFGRKDIFQVREGRILRGLVQRLTGHFTGENKGILLKPYENAGSRYGREQQRGLREIFPAFRSRGGEGFFYFGQKKTREE